MYYKMEPSTLDTALMGVVEERFVRITEMIKDMN